jgi:predicted HTH transcriptional regulator
MSEDQLRRIFAEGETDWLEDHATEGLDAQQVVAFLDTQNYFELFKLPYPRDRAGVLDRLVRERLVDPVQGGYAIRRIGALLFAKNLNEFPDLARKPSRVVVYTGPSKLETRLDITGTRGYAVGFQSLVQFVMEQLPQNELIEGALRRAVKMVPEVAIRELVANALIHQDLLIPGTSVMIEIYSDRVEISNPGEPVVPVERFIDGYQSRNERLADFMRRIGICEEKSSGIDRVVHNAEIFQLPAPDFRAGYRRTIATIYGHKDFDEMDRNDRVRACYQHCCLKYVMNQKMTNQSLRERFRLAESKADVVSRIIQETVSEGKIKPSTDSGGSKRYAKYIPNWA